MRELGAALIVQPPSLSATLDRMERAGLVTRKSDPYDQRTRRVALTSAGRALLRRALPRHTAWADRVLAGLSTGEQATLGALLQKLGEHMDAAASTREHTKQLNQP
jgi:DNA-binding MarR family transcriptional regulator